MATKKRGTMQPRKALSRLKKLGLFKGRTDKPSRYGLAQIKKFAAVLRGDAKVVKVPRKVAKEYRDQYRVKGDRVVIPSPKGEKVRYNKRRGEITRTREGVSARMPRNVNSPLDLPRGPNIRYVVPLSGGHVRLRWDDYDQLVKDMTQYEQGRKGAGQGYANWWKYVEIEDIRDSDK